MPTFLVTQRHSPENCPGHNEKVRGVLLKLVEKSEELSKKHGVKLVGGCLVDSEHMVTEIYEAPSLEAFQAFNMEPEMGAMGAYYTMEIKVGVDVKESMKMLKQTK
ncbi:MAG: hypothetical protein ABIH76_08105 [Candidatus Bathyarchaeota archaeon]